jgi:hypothetical protein
VAQTNERIEQTGPQAMMKFKVRGTGSSRAKRWAEREFP